MSLAPAPVLGAIEASLGTVEEVAARCHERLADELCWFPIRHHSPSCARHVEALLRARKPRLVLIEGPSVATWLVPHIVDGKTRAPVAIYTSFRDDDGDLARSVGLAHDPDAAMRFSSWLPLLPCSPELVAMTTAHRLRADVELIDLPAHVPAAHARREGADGASPERQRLLAESTFFERLAAAGGYRTFDEAWDSLFEARTFDGHEAFRREMALFCAAARATASPRRMAIDATQLRERHMLASIGRALAARGLGPRDAVVVTGGFHMFHDAPASGEPPSLPGGALYTTVVPYSYPRVSSLSGYAAGCRAPRYYEHLHASKAPRPADDVALTYVTEVVRAARALGDVLSAADAIAAAETASLLASLRGRASPVLDDLHDALITCCCKGDPASAGALLLRAIAEVDLGSRIGRVSPRVPRLPLVDDFYREIARLGLDASLSREGATRVEVDLRAPEGASRAAFFFRLIALGVPFAANDRRAERSPRLVHESFELRYTPAVEASLIASNVWGDTILSAAIARVRERLSTPGISARAACADLLDAGRLAAPGLVDDLAPRCLDAIDRDGDLLSLGDALSSARMLSLREAARGERDETPLAIADRAFTRGCLAIAAALRAPDELHEPLASALLCLAGHAEATARPDDRSLLVAEARRSVHLDARPFVRGALLGLLSQLGAVAPSALAAELSSLAFAPAAQQAGAGDLLSGMMATARASLLLGDGVIVDAVDALLRAAGTEAFLTMLPRLREAFERAGRHGGRLVAEQVARRYALTAPEAISQGRSSTSALAQRLDDQAARIIAGWLS